ncbi:MAG: hypothetical protein Q9222_005574 [Ikaeria aurantiellina]
MDPVTAFSLAAGILQVVDISSRAVKKCHELYKDGSLAEHRETAEIADALANAADTLSASIQSSNQPRSKEDSEIFDLSIKCRATARDLVARLNKLKADQGSRLQALTKSVEAMRQKQMLKDKQAALKEYQQVLDTQILMRLDTSSLRLSQDIDILTKEVRDLAIAMENGQRTVEQLLARHGRVIIDHFDRRFDDHVHVLQGHSFQQRLNESLFFPEISSRQEQIPDEFRGTNQWIFEEPATLGRSQPWSNFPAWLEHHPGAYWISGRPGSGKSTLMKSIINDPRTTKFLSKWSPQTNLLVISFYFWNTGTSLQESATGLLRSLLYQISMQIPDEFYRIYNHNHPVELDLRREWTDQRLLSTLKLFMERKSKATSICAFIDGLDEFTGDEELLLDIVRLFIKTPNSKVCVASRPEQAFREEFQSCPQLRVHKLNHQDIQHTAKQKLYPVLERYYPDETYLFHSLVYRLAKKAQGVFLWLDLIVEDLIKGAKSGDNLDELRSRLLRTPDSIYGMYAYKMQNLDPLYREEAFKYFSVLIAASDLGRQVDLLGLASAQEEAWPHVQQLHTEFFHTPAFEISCRRLESRIISRCGGLVDIEEERELSRGSEILRHHRPLTFIHKTVVDYLKEKHGEFFLQPAQLLAAHSLIAQDFLGLLLISETHDSDGVVFNPSKKLPYMFTAMRVISTLTGRLEDREAFGPLQIELTTTAFGILQLLLDRYNVTEETFGSKNIYGLALPQGLQGRAGAWHLVQDPLYWNAFYGCTAFVCSKVSIESLPDRQLLDLLSITSLGLHCLVEGGGYLLDRLSYFALLNTFDAILHHELDVNQKVTGIPTSRRCTTSSICATSLWSLLRASVHFVSRASIEDSHTWTKRCIGIINKLLGGGTDPNSTASYYCQAMSRRFESILEVFLVVSPLYMLTSLSPDVLLLLTPVKERLSAAGALSRRRFRLFVVEDDSLQGRQFCKFNLERSEMLWEAMQQDVAVALFENDFYLELNPRAESVFVEMLGTLSEGDMLNQKILDQMPEQRFDQRLWLHKLALEMDAEEGQQRVSATA